MKKILSFGVLCSLLSLPAVSKADFLIDFNSAVATGGTANFGPQNGWTINDPTEDVSFLVPVAGFGQSVALGGYLSAPSVGAVNLTQSASETLAGGTFSVDFALVNSDDADPGSFFEADDSFTIGLAGTNGFSYALSLIPTGAEDIREILSTNSTDTGGIQTSDYANPAFYSLSISFTANGADLDYVALITGSTSGSFTGTIPGAAASQLTAFGIGFDATSPDPADAGSNFLLVDNFAFVPEAGTAALSLMAIGALGLRRRRR
ncbi:MAG: hypothetical protein EOP86_15330 [Verrucomicrobiaceae bacterium]|nr:MAG: hypothetical protein EOP86_15330 [Verrucomicrobiaceae bacterium]